MSESVYFSHRKTTIAAILVSTFAGAFLSACGGGEDENGSDSSFVTPLKVTNAETKCTSLTGKVIDAAYIGEATTGAEITSAKYITALPDRLNTAGTAIDQATPDYCEIQVSIKPVDTTAPVIKSQINLPTEWNGKKLQFGGGGYNGVLITGVQQSRSAGPDTPFPLTQGYMTTGTDSGHQNSSTEHPATFALNDESLKNFAYAAHKKTHDVSVKIAELYYQHRPKRSYFMGGSQGGREAMMMAQKFPNDYDGIVAIDPVMSATGLWTFQNSFGAVQSASGSWLGGKTQLLHDTVIATCDSIDGIADGVISNYKACKPLADAAIEAKRCASGSDEGSTCFSDGQLAAIKHAYTGISFPYELDNGVTSYAGYPYGGEGLSGNWERWEAGSVAPTSEPDSTPTVSRNYLYGSYYTRFFIAKDSTFNALTYDPANFKDRVIEVSKLIDATNTDLTAFYKRGGKLILRENLGDKGQSPLTGLNYWDSVVTKMGKSTVDQFFAAYVATGLPHTSAGIAAGASNAPTYGIPGQIDLLEPLDKWVENGTKPGDGLTLTNREALPPYALVASKPLCHYPKYPKYIGTSVAGGNFAENYTCSTQD